MKRLIATVLMSSVFISAWSAERTSAIAALHSKVITPASNALFQAESTPPSTADEWEAVRLSAAALARAAQQLASRDLAKDQDRWLQFAHALQQHAQQAVGAAEKMDQDALVIANGDMVSVCEDCHAKYRDSGRSMKQ